MRYTEGNPGRSELLVLVALGGVVGALARWSISEVLPHENPVAWPTATFIANLSGCLLLGLLVGRLDRFGVDSASWWGPRARPMLASGVLGGFTTLSAYSAEVEAMLRAGAAGTAIAYATSSLVLGIALVALGRAVMGAGVVGRGIGPGDLAMDEQL